MLSVRKCYAMARVHLIRRQRKLRQEPLAFMLLFVPVFFISILVVGRLPIPGYEMIRAEPGAYVYGTRVGDGLDAAILDRARTISVLSFLTLVFVVSFREIRAGDTVSTDVDLHLTVVRPGTAVGAAMLRYVTFVGQFFGAILLLAAVSFGLGSRDPVAGLLIALATASLILTAVSLTYAGSLLVKFGFARSAVLAANRRLVGGLGLFGFVLALRMARRTGAALGGTPLGWYADLAFLTTMPEAVPTRALAVPFVTALSVAGGFLVARALCEPLWRADAVEQADSPEDSGGLVDRLGAVLSTVVGRPVAQATMVTWRRVYREPVALMYVVSTGALVYVAASGITAELPNSAPTVVAIYGAAIVGMGATLNPLGNEGVALPTVLTTRRGGTYLLAGQALSAALPGVVLVTGGTVVAGVVTGAPWTVVAPATVVAVTLAAITAPLSLAIGVRFPQYEGVELLSNSGIQTPRPQAVGVLALTLALVGAPALVGMHSPLPVSRLVGTVVGVGVTVACGVAIGWRSFQFAVERVESFELA